MKLFKPCLTALFAVVFSVLFAPLHAQYVGVGQSLITNPPKPTWQWDFARTGALPPGAVFSRTSGARQYLSDGTLGWAPENLITYSQQIDNAAWTSTRSSVSADATTAPDGTTTADKLVEDSSASTTHLRYSATFSQPAGTYRSAVYAKAAERTAFRMENAGGVGTYGASFNLSNGTTTGVDAGVTATITSVGNGWYLCEIAFTWPTLGNTNLWFYMQSVAGTNAYSGNGSSGLYLWGAQTNRTPNVSSAYWPTTSAAYYGPRFDFDPATKAPLGYLSEMASTNSFQRSQEIDNAYWTKQRVSITADQIAAPDGTTTADKITEDGTTGPRGFYKALTLTSGSYYGYSLFVKAGTRDKFFVSIEGSAATRFAAAMFNLATGTVSETKVGSVSGTIHSTSLRSVGGGWYRASIVASVADTSITPVWGLSSTATGLSASWGEVTYAGDGVSYAYAWGAQVEDAGVGVTSYIATTSAAVTRAQDTLKIPLSSIGFDATKGGVIAGTYQHHTLYPTTPGYANQLFYITTDPDVWQQSIQGITSYQSSTTARSYMVSGGVDQYFLSLGTSKAPFVRSRIAFSWGNTRAGGAVDAGAFAGANGSYSFPATTPTTLYIGQYADRNLQGTIESLAYYRGSRPDALVQGVSR